jgi:STE24 endopeptidase
MAAVAVLGVAGLPLQQAVSRRAEAAADLAALEITRDPATFVAAKRGLAQANLSDPAPPGWVYVLWSSHPTPAARLEMGERWPHLTAGGRGPP